MVGPFADGDADTVLVCTRYCTYIPFRYVSLLLNTNLEPRQAWERVSTAITNDGNQVACRPLLDFLKVAATRAIDNAASHVVRAWPSLPQPANAQLIDFFQKLVKRDLPDAYPTAAAPAGAIAIATQIGTLAAEQRQTRQEANDRQSRKEAGKGLNDVFGEVGVHTLMRLCQVNNQLLLPEVYTDLARAPKKQRQAVLQNAVTEAGRVLGVYHPILVPPGVVDKVMTMEWATPNPDDLSQGINLFLVGQPTPSEEVQMLHTLQLQHLVYSGSAAPSLTDARTLTAPPTVRLPSSLPQAAYALASFQVYLRVLLGGTHQVTAHVRHQRDLMDRNLHTLTYDTTAHLPALFLRHIQRAIVHWAGLQRDNTIPQTWPAKDVVSEAVMGNYSWATRIPEAYLTTRPGRQPPTPQAPGPAPAPTPGQAPPAERNEQVMETRADGADPRFAPIIARQIATHTVKAKIKQGLIPAPKDARGKQRCLTWAPKGMCNSRCGNAHDHRNDHTEEEQADFLGWCTEHWV
jgi:hypothetical protein